MNYKEKWKLILEEKRFREKSATIESDGRNTFENDYGRLISSAPIRRLQDKTQVFPLEESDYIRTRLTHSLEVSYLASSIGQSIENLLLNKKELDLSLKGNLSSLLRVAGLVHDLGNPPFGHFGEEAIKKFFKQYFEKNKKTSLSDLEKSDFENFDGNVQTLRILSKLYYFGDEFGYNLNYSSLASIIKYPSNSLEGNKKPTTEIAKKKFGYFVTETETYKKINDYLKLGNRRHPVVYLLEAADDIAYSAADIEDGIKLGKVNLDDIERIFAKNLDKNKEAVLNKIKDLKEKF
ncbi:dGTP triphosphohydrolase [Psychroflexus tropicus]|uniref:dGTP triphosphohydrolase n=1 Tax=Psychroflexus tropicus TaxID=197345 RepID=UPI00039F3C50|nr:dNTP triphosphohydrolase [Psychroflexus tropicus]